MRWPAIKRPGPPIGIHPRAYPGSSSLALQVTRSQPPNRTLLKAAGLLPPGCMHWALGRSQALAPLPLALCPACPAIAIHTAAASAATSQPLQVASVCRPPTDLQSLSTRPPRPVPAPVPSASFSIVVNEHNNVTIHQSHTLPSHILPVVLSPLRNRSLRRVIRHPASSSSLLALTTSSVMNRTPEQSPTPRGGKPHPYRRHQCDRGDMADPKNYCGIAHSNVLNNAISTWFNTALQDYVWEKELVSPTQVAGQAGVQPETRTSPGFAHASPSWERSMSTTTRGPANCCVLRKQWTTAYCWPGPETSSRAP